MKRSTTVTAAAGVLALSAMLGGCTDLYRIQDAHNVGALGTAVTTMGAPVIFAYTCEPGIDTITITYDHTSGWGAGNKNRRVTVGQWIHNLPINGEAPLNVYRPTQEWETIIPFGGFDRDTLYTIRGTSTHNGDVATSVQLSFDDLEYMRASRVYTAYSETLSAAEQALTHDEFADTTCGTPEVDGAEAAERTSAARTPAERTSAALAG